MRTKNKTVLVVERKSTRNNNGNIGTFVFAYWFYKTNMKENMNENKANKYLLSIFALLRASVVDILFF